MLCCKNARLSLNKTHDTSVTTAKYYYDYYLPLKYDHLGTNLVLTKQPQLLLKQQERRLQNDDNKTASVVAVAEVITARLENDDKKTAGAPTLKRGLSLHVERRMLSHGSTM